jgi:hypothetical protein
MSRLYLTAREYEGLLKKQNGICCVEDCEESQDLQAEHSSQTRGAEPNPTSPCCATCHKVKTLRDIKAIWKVKRLNGEALSQRERRRHYGAQLRGPPFVHPHRKPGAPPWKR